MSVLGGVKENVMHIHKGMLLSCRKRAHHLLEPDRPGERDVTRRKPDAEGRVTRVPKVGGESLLCEHRMLITVGWEEREG